MFDDLKKKVVVITGGSGFFGSQLVEAYLKNDTKVINIDIKNGKIKHKNLFFYKCNIASEKNLKYCSNKIKKKFKIIDILINNAAIDHPPVKKKSGNNFENLNLGLLQKEISVGLVGAILCSKIFGTTMSKQKTGGVIVNISSDLGIIAPDQRLYSNTKFVKPVSYSVIKHGIIGLTKYTAAYWAKKNIRCNAFAPGGIDNKQNQTFKRRIKKLIPLARMALKNEYNNTVLFLSSNNSSYITGATIIADGGRSII